MALVPNEVVTVTFTTAPAVPTGSVTVTEVAVFAGLDKMVAKVVPKSTTVALDRLVPSTVTC